MKNWIVPALALIASVAVASTPSDNATPVANAEGYAPNTSAESILSEAEGPSANSVEGLQLSVMEDSVNTGDTVELHWEIVPDGETSVSIVMGIILPDGSAQYYRGPKKGFSEVADIGAAKPIVRDFPFNTRMMGTLSISIPDNWPEGSYQFMAHVYEGTTCIEIVYSNSFEIE